MNRPDAPKLMSWIGADYYAVLRGERELTEDQIDRLLDHDLNVAIAQAQEVYPEFANLPSPAQLVLVDQIYQMGKGGVAQFHKMLAAFAAADWDRAADEILDSQEHNQTPYRAHANAALLRKCNAPIPVTPIDLVAELDLTEPTSRTAET
jgi:hypothetical protein